MKSSETAVLNNFTIVQNYDNKKQNNYKLDMDDLNYNQKILHNLLQKKNQSKKLNKE